MRTRDIDMCRSNKGNDSLFMIGQLDGIELDGGDDDEFGDEILRVISTSWGTCS